MFGFGGNEKSQEEMARAHEKQVILDENIRRLKAGMPTINVKGFNKGAERVGTSFGQFGAVAMRPQRVFSQEQDALSQMFGGGDKMWGLGDESDTQVTIHNDLHPSMSDDRDETASMFGFGGRI